MGKMAGLVRQWDEHYLDYLEARAAGDKAKMAEAKKGMDATMRETMDVMECTRERGQLVSKRR